MVRMGRKVVALLPLLAAGAPRRRAAVAAHAVCGGIIVDRDGVRLVRVPVEEEQRSEGACPALLLANDAPDVSAAFATLRDVGAAKVRGVVRTGRQAAYALGADME